MPSIISDEGMREGTNTLWWSSDLAVSNGGEEVPRQGNGCAAGRRVKKPPCAIKQSHHRSASRAVPGVTLAADGGGKMARGSAFFAGSKKGEAKGSVG